MKLTRTEVMKLAAEAQVDPRTVTKIYNGEKSRRILVRERVEAAARSLGLPGPPVPLESCQEGGK